jgi:ACS family hexuronate transporter-like MFS transporter
MFAGGKLCTVHDVREAGAADEDPPRLPSASTPVGRARRVTMLARLLGIQLTTAMVVLGIPPLAASLRNEFDLSRGGAGLLTTAAFLGVVAASWPAGRVVNAVGVRRSMIWASAGLGVSLAVTGLAPTYVLVLAALFVAGLFYSAVTPATNTGVVAWASPGFRTRAMAIKQMGVTAGASLAAALIPLLAARYGWRVAAAVVGALVVVAGAGSAWWFERPPEARTFGPSAPLEDRALVVKLGVAALLLIAVQHCVATHFILALQDEGVALVAAGGALSLLQLSATGARFGWAWVADRLLGGNASLTLLVLCACSAIVLAAMTLLGATASPVGSAVLLGITTQAGNGLIQLVLADAGGAAPASSTGLGMALGFSGTVIGPPLFGFLADAWTYRSSWIALSVVALAAGAIAWITSRRVARRPLATSSFVS